MIKNMIVNLHSGLAAASSLLILSSPIMAQSNKAFDPLAAPTIPSRCAFQLLTPKDSALSIALKYHFKDGEEMRSDRDIELTYDAAGAPISIALLATERATEESISTHAMMVWFGRGESDRTYAIETLSGAGQIAVPTSRASVPNGWKKLSESDTQRVRALALTLREPQWCREPPPGSRPPPAH